MFVIKCVFVDYPLTAIFTNIFIGLLLFGAAFRVLERPVNTSLDSFVNAVWMSLVTMTTVGYGDYYPISIQGRVITIFLIIWGSFSTSILVVVITNYLLMNPQESHTITLYNKLSSREQMVRKAT